MSLSFSLGDGKRVKNNFSESPVGDLASGELVALLINAEREEVAVDQAQAKLKSLHESIAIEVEMQIASIQDNTHRRRFTTWVYWTLSFVPVKSICAALSLHGEKVTSHNIPRFVDSFEGPPCPECAESMEFTSRSQVSEFLRGSRRYGIPMTCRSCRDAARAARNEESARSLAEQWQEVMRLRQMPYSQYLQTDHWQSLRVSRIRSAGYRCQLCNQGGRLDVHHRTYENRGNEGYSDLIVLCRPCHAKHHDKIPG